MKKIMSVVLLGMMMILFAGCGGGGSDNSSGSGSTKLSSAKAITEFSLNGVEGTINETAKTISVVMPSGTSLTGLIATYTTTGSEVDIEGVGQESGQRINDFTNPVIYTVTAENDTKQNYTVTVTVASSSEPQSSAKAIMAYSLDGAQGTIDETGKTIAVSLPLGADVTALVATFTTTGASVKVGSIVQTNGQTPNNFTNPVVYTVTAADASTQNYTVTVTLLAERQKATAISVSMVPNNPSYVPEGVYCTRTTSIRGYQTVTPDDGNTIISWEFLENGTSVKSGSGTLADLKVTPPELFPPFGTRSTVTYRATADGVVSDSTTETIT